MKTADTTPGDIVLYFEFHYAPRLRALHLPAQTTTDFFDDQANEVVIREWSREVLLPATEMLCNALLENKSATIALAVSGAAIEQLAQYAPEAIESLQRLNETGSVEWLGLPFNYSLSLLVSDEVYRTEVTRHSEMMHHYFGASPAVLLAAPYYDPDVARMAKEMGFEGVLVRDGLDAVRHHSILSDTDSGTRLLVTNTTLSDEIAMRFGAGNVRLTVDRFMAQFEDTHTSPAVIGCSFDVFRAHREADIEAFFREFILNANARSGWNLVTPATVLRPERETADRHPCVQTGAHDLTQWLSNDMQRNAFKAVEALAEPVSRLLDERLKHTWYRLLAADHFRYMVSNHDKLASHYPSAYEAFINYQKVLNSLSAHLQAAPVVTDDEAARALEYERQHPATPVWALQEQSQYKQVTEKNL